MAALILLVACSPDQDGDGGEFGPLAVTDNPAPTVALQAFGGRGPIDITDRCVTLQVSNKGTRLLVWRSGEVSWDGESRHILFTQATEEDAGTMRIQDGDTIEVGGASLEGEDPDSRPEPDWIAPPDPSCSGKLWSVHSVGR